MRHCFAYSLFLALLALSGCGQEVQRGDLGHVIYRLPKLPEASQPYELPQLKGMKSVDEAAVGIPGPAQSEIRAA